MTTAEITAQWHKAKAAYEAAIDSFGYDDPRTSALEEAEAEACERYLAVA